MSMILLRAIFHTFFIFILTCFSYAIWAQKNLEFETSVEEVREITKLSRAERKKKALALISDDNMSERDKSKKLTFLLLEYPLDLFEVGKFYIEKNCAASRILSLFSLSYGRNPFMNSVNKTG